MNKEQIYPTRGCYTQTNPFRNRKNDRKIESYDENRRDEGTEICIRQAGTERFNLEIECKVKIIQHCPKNLFFGFGCLKSSTQVVKLGLV